jgi:hypothetical protein
LEFDSSRSDLSGRRPWLLAHSAHLGGRPKNQDGFVAVMVEGERRRSLISEPQHSCLQIDDI